MVKAPNFGKIFITEMKPFPLIVLDFMPSLTVEASLSIKIRTLATHWNLIFKRIWSTTFEKNALKGSQYFRKEWNFGIGVSREGMLTVGPGLMEPHDFDLFLQTRHLQGSLGSATLWDLGIFPFLFLISLGGAWMSIFNLLITFCNFADVWDSICHRG